MPTPFVSDLKEEKEPTKDKTEASLLSLIPENLRKSTFTGFDPATFKVDVSNQAFHDIKRNDLPVDGKQAFALSLFLYSQDKTSPSPQEWLDFAQKTLQLKNKHIFYIVALLGRNDILNLLQDSLEPQNLKDIMAVDNYAAFSGAAANGHLESLQWMAEKMSPDADGLKEMIKGKDYAAFFEAAGNGHIAVLNWLIEQTPPNEQDKKILKMVKANRYEAFKGAATKGHTAALNWLVDKAPKKFESMVSADDYGAFRNAAKNGHLEILQWLFNRDPKKFEAMVEANGYKVFRKAANNHHFHVLQWLADKAPLEAMIAADNYAIFGDVSKNYDPTILNWLLEKAPAHHADLIGANHFASFRYAAKRGDLNTMQWLVEQAPDKLNAMISAYDNDAFRQAVKKGHQPIIEWLLQKSTCLAYAEAHMYEYGSVINPFIESKLQSIHQEQETALINNPNVAFDISEDKARYYFYVLRNLVRHNDRSKDEEIRFLLNVPSIRALAHQEITAGQSNELLKLAMAIENTEALNMLLSIPEVRRLARDNNFYRETNRGVDLRQLAADRESSMTQLTPGEARRFNAVIQQYQPITKEKGVDTVMNELRTTLEDRYTSHPASIMINGTPTDLPFKYQEFRAMNLQGDDLQKALEAYYKHPDHTAWRYLSRPNNWMHPRASYVEINQERTERWSTFEGYQPLISVLYLAATDVNAHPIDGHTLQTRIDNFINELALIGRAHNWDKIRTRNGKQEAYDDLEGDRPSCYSGMKRRLFQSVIGHPLFSALTEEVIRLEIRDFALNHFKSLITDDNKKQFQEAFEETIYMTGEGDALKSLDIPLEKQQAFQKYLADKYGEEYSTDGSLLLMVSDIFHLNPDSPSAINKCHAMRLDGLTQLRSYIDDRCEPALVVHTHSIFTSTPESKTQQNIPQNEKDKERSDFKPD